MASFLQLEQWMGNVHRSHAFIKLPTPSIVEMPTPSFSIPFPCSKETIWCFVFLPWHGREEPRPVFPEERDLAWCWQCLLPGWTDGQRGSRKPRSRDSRYKTAESTFSLALLLLPNLIHMCKAPNALLLILFQQSKVTQHALKINHLNIRYVFCLNTLLFFVIRETGSFKPKL